MEKSKKVKLSVTLSAEVVNQIRDLADLQSRSFSSMLDYLVKEQLAEKSSSK